jgi:hypothetical protein
MDSLFAQQRIRFLANTDFELNSGTILSLKDKSCCLVLFHDNSSNSQKLATIWTSLVTKVVGPIFASCDLMNDPEVVQAFNKVSMDRDNPLSWLNLKRVPLIVTYRDGFPVCAYNGIISESMIMSYASELVCSPDYHERVIMPAVPDQTETEDEHPISRP